MEQLDFLLIFTMDVKTYSCAIWYLQFMSEEFKLGKHMGEKYWAASKCTRNISELKQKRRGWGFVFSTQSVVLSYPTDLEVEFSV